MNHEQKMQALKEIFDKCLAIADAKGRDYSGTEDGMGNFKDFGWKGIIVRLGDKYHRLKNLTKAEAVVDESVEDTLSDLINYGALALVMKELEDKESAAKWFSRGAVRKAEEAIKKKRRATVFAEQEDEFGRAFEASQDPMFRHGMKGTISRHPRLKGIKDESN